MTENTFDPLNIKPYFGKSFTTKNNSEYKVTSEGKFSGRKGIEGANIMIIAGINPKDYSELKNAFHHSKDAYDEIIKRKATAPAVGKLLAISLTSEDANKRSRNGIITSIVSKIE